METEAAAAAVAAGRRFGRTAPAAVPAPETPAEFPNPPKDSARPRAGHVRAVTTVAE